MNGGSVCDDEDEVAKSDHLYRYVNSFQKLDHCDDVKPNFVQHRRSGGGSASTPTRYQRRPRYDEFRRQKAEAMAGTDLNRPQGHWSCSTSALNNQRHFYGSTSIESFRSESMQRMTPGSGAFPVHHGRYNRSNSNTYLGWRSMDTLNSGLIVKLPADIPVSRASSFRKARFCSCHCRRVWFPPAYDDESLREVGQLSPKTPGQWRSSPPGRHPRHLPATPTSSRLRLQPQSKRQLSPKPRRPEILVFHHGPGAWAVLGDPRLHQECNELHHPVLQSRLYGRTEATCRGQSRPEARLDGEQFRVCQVTAQVVIRIGCLRRPTALGWAGKGDDVSGEWTTSHRAKHHFRVLSEEFRSSLFVASVV